MEKSGEFLSLRANLALIEPKFEPWGGLNQPQKWVQLGFIFLDFSLNPKLDTCFGQANTNLDPEGPSQPIPSRPCKVAAFKVRHVRGEYVFLIGSNMVDLICPLAGIGSTELPWPITIARLPIGM